jgi:hypothetical protein
MAAPRHSGGSRLGYLRCCTVAVDHVGRALLLSRSRVPRCKRVLRLSCSEGPSGLLGEQGSEASTAIFA